MENTAVNNTDIDSADRPEGNKRNFRQATEVENFYRFVHENDLRAEAKLILQAIVKQQKADAKKKRKRKKKVLQ